MHIELLVIKTKGDKITHLPLAKIGGKGLFVKEIEEALLSGQADLAVHSMKDLPMHLPPGLIIAAMPARGEAEDIYLSCHYSGPDSLPPGAVLGSSSLRRQAQMLINYPHLTVKSLRGNIITRLDKLARGEYDAIVLAAVGLTRLNLTCPHMLPLALKTYIPAAGQGALGVECKKERTELLNLLAFMNHPPTQLCVEAERAFLRELNGSCHAPIAAYATLASSKTSSEASSSPNCNRANRGTQQLNICGFIAADNGQPHVYHCLVAKLNSAPPAAQLAQACELGITLAQEIRELGVKKGLNY